MRLVAHETEALFPFFLMRSNGRECFCLSDRHFPLVKVSHSHCSSRCLDKGVDLRAPEGEHPSRFDIHRKLQWWEYDSATCGASKAEDALGNQQPLTLYHW